MMSNFLAKARPAESCCTTGRAPKNLEKTQLPSVTMIHISPVKKAALRNVGVTDR